MRLPLQRYRTRLGIAEAQKRLKGPMNAYTRQSLTLG
jgi:hypothetical protein